MNIVDIPLNGYQMQQLNPDAVIHTYTDLYKYKTVDELFRNTNKIIILYLIQSKNQGHWCCLFKQNSSIRGFPCYNFFDPYGIICDGQLDWLSKEKKDELNEQNKYLLELLKDVPCYYNYINFQNKHSQTCGDHTTYRLHNSNSTIEEYADFFLKNGINNPDDYVSEYCFKKLGLI
jgi:hypothetical protein